MRITAVVQNYPPERGPVRYTRDAAIELARRGHEVTVITGIPHYPTGSAYSPHKWYRPSVAMESGVRVIRTPLVMGSNRQIMRRLFGMVTFIFSALPWVVGSQRADLIIASVPPVTVSVIGLIASVIRRAPLVIILRDVEPLDSMAARGIKIRGWWRYFVNVCMWIYRRCDRLVVIHKDQISPLVEYGVDPSRVAVIPHSIDLATFGEASLVRNATKRPRVEGRYATVYLGTVGVSHDLQSLVRAFADPEVRSLPFDLVIVGDGECLDACKVIAKQASMTNVSFQPSISEEDVPGTLAQADLLIASFRNGLNPVISSKIYEYCASGKPIIVFGDCAAAELVVQVGNGWTCPCRSALELQAALQAYLSDPEAARVKARAGRRYIEEFYSRESAGAKWSELITGIAADRQRTRRPSD